MRDICASRRPDPHREAEAEAQDTQRVPLLHQLVEGHDAIELRDGLQARGSQRENGAFAGILRLPVHLGSDADAQVLHSEHQGLG